MQALNKLTQSTGISDLAYSFGAKAGTILFGIANQSCLAWFLGPAERGSYAVCFLVANLLTIFFVFGVDKGGLFYISSGKMETSKAIRCTLALGLFSSLIAMLVGFLLTFSRLSIFEKASHTTFLLALFIVPMQIATINVSAIVQALRAFKTLAYILVAQAALHLCGILTFVYFLDWGANGAILAAIVSLAFLPLAMIFFLKRNGMLDPAPLLWKDARLLLHYGGRSTIGSISSSLNFQIGGLLMAFLANREEIAYFTIAVDLMTRVVVISDITSFVVQPRASADPRGRPELVAQAGRIVFLICAVIIGILLLVARPLVFVLFSPAFAPIIPLMSIIGLGVAVRCAGKGLVTFLDGTNRPGAFSVATVISTLVNLVLLILLFPSLRMAGAAWALTCSYFASTIILMAAFRIFSGMSLSQTWMPRKADLQLLGSFIHQARQTVRSFRIVRPRGEAAAAGSIGKEPHDARSEKTSTSA